jgi:hypothetical protein
MVHAMSLTIDRPSFEHDDAPETTSAMATEPPETTAVARVALAAVLLGPAAIHFAMIPSHAAESAAEAIGFAVAAWAGALLGVGMLVRPARRLLTAAVVVNVAMIAIWVRSRTAGLPFGSHAGHKEAATGIDLLSTGMEAAAVLLCIALLVKPGLGRRLGLAGGVIAGAVASFAMVATSVALASPSARNHAASSHGDAAVTDAGHVHSADAATGINEGLLATNADGTTAPAADDGHAHPADTTGGSSAVAGGAALPGADGGSDGGSADDGHNHGAGAAIPASLLADRCDLALNPVSFWDETNVVHGGAAVAATPGTATLDELIAETTRPGGEAKDAKVVAMLGEASDAEYHQWINWLPAYVGAAHAASASSAPDDNAGHGGHLGPQPWTAMTDQAECDQLNKELDQARSVAMKYPHPPDAEDAGWTKVTGYVPGIAAHYMKFGIVDGTFDIGEPEMLLYDGTDPTSSIVGLSYYMIHDSDYEPTQGFTGPNDHFHRHIGLCVNGTGVIGDSTTTEEECAARGGVKQGGTGGWMNHVWIVPGCESPWGMFSGASPLLENSLHDASGTDGGGCAGSNVRSRFDMTPGTVDNVPGVLVGKAAGAA